MGNGMGKSLLKWPADHFSLKPCLYATFRTAYVDTLRQGQGSCRQDKNGFRVFYL